jgi:FKBP-type peptidyl-prolyl cis-trans isomerase
MPSEWTKTSSDKCEAVIGLNDVTLKWTKRGVLAALVAGALAACNKGVSKETQEKNAAYLADIMKQPGMIRDESGLVYKVLSSPNPSAPQPHADSTIKIQYEGRLTNDVVFDSSYERGVPAVFPLENLIPAWKIAIPKMHKGDVWEIYVPAELGYGDAGAGASIPPGAVLKFKIALIDFE